MQYWTSPIDARGQLKVFAVKALCLLAVLTFPSLGTADPPAQHVNLSEIARSLELLQRAGASQQELDRFEQDMPRWGAADVARFAAKLQRQSPAMTARMLEGIRHDSRYVLGADSLPQSATPKGVVFEFMFDSTRIFPGTTRKISIYVPSQYTADRPACVYVGLDGLLFELPTVFDNLIHRHEMPITIAIGVAAGESASADAPAGPRSNRSFEFDSLNDSLARFLLEEVFPEVERRKTPAGLPLRLSAAPDDRAAGGISTGAIGAFTLAWTRPDAFRRVFTASGTFVGMRGGDRYPVLVRKTEPKPIRVFMQDGSRDGMDGSLGEVGDWWMSNQAMQRALAFSGYQVRHVWGEGPHGSKQGATVFPDAMRWLWRNWPAPVVAGQSQNAFLTDILLPGQEWEIVPGKYLSARAMAADPSGAPVIWDAVSSKTWKLAPNGHMREYPAISQAYEGIAFGADGRAYVTNTDGISSYGSDGRRTTLTGDKRGANLIVTHGGNVYFTESGATDYTGKLWLIKPDGVRLQLDSDLNHPGAIALSPDGLWLAVAGRKNSWGHSYRVERDGSTVRTGQGFYSFHAPDEASDAGTSSWIADREGRLFAGTHVGVQIFDRNGRVRAILPVTGGSVTALAFGGASFDTLYIAAGNKIYKRRLKISALPPAAPPMPLPAWSARLTGPSRNPSAVRPAFQSETPPEKSPDTHSLATPHALTSLRDGVATAGRCRCVYGSGSLSGRATLHTVVRHCGPIEQHAEYMTDESILRRLTPLLRDVFDNDALVATPELTASDVAGWDSLGNVRLFLEIERAFSVRFSATEISSLKNVGQLAELVGIKARHAAP